MVVQGTSAKLQERFSEVKQEDDERKSLVQQLLQRSTDFLRRIIVPVEGQGGVTLSYACLIVIGIRLKTTSGGCQRSTGRNSATGGVWHAAASAPGGSRTES